MIQYFEETTSTMSLLALSEWQKVEDKYVLLTTDYQTAGRGQRGNHWESARGENLLLGLAVRPTFLLPQQQFLLSEVTALAAQHTLSEVVTGVTLKWPNDLYYKDNKLGGMLLEHQLQGAKIVRTIIGMGINVNQTIFLSDAPNPISLQQIAGQRLSRTLLLERFFAHFQKQYERLEQGDTAAIHNDYLSVLYRREGVYPYADAKGTFQARLQGVAPDGTLSLLDSEGNERYYQFKEVRFL